MPNINKQITLTTKGSNAGPLFDVYYSTDCVNYTICVDGNDVSLPSVGSTAIVTVPDTTICIKLINQSSACGENYIVSGSTTTTTSTTTTSTTTTSTTTIGPTTTTTTFSSNPCICTEVVITSAGGEVQTFNCYGVNQNYVYFSAGTYYLCAAEIGGLLQAFFAEGTTGTISPVGNCKTGTCPPASTTTTAAPTTTTTTIGCADCGINQFGNYSPSDYHVYPDRDICNSVSSSNNLQYYAYDRPNRFTLYDSTGYITSSGWVGYASYPGPWGSSLNVNPDGIIPFTFASGTGRYMRVEAGPADTEIPISDAYEWVLVCQNTTTTTTAAPTTTTTTAAPTTTTTTAAPTTTTTTAGPEIYTHGVVRGTCSDYCTINYLIQTITPATGDFTSLTIGDTIYNQGGYSGWVAYSNISTDTTTGPFKIAEIDGFGVVTDILVCSGGSCVPL